MSVLSVAACWNQSCQQVTARRTSAFISVPRSKCTRVTLRDPESVASTEQDGNRRCGNIGSGRDPSNSDTTRRERDGSRCEPMGQSSTSQNTTRALRTPRALPRQCLLPNRPTRRSGDRSHHMRRHVSLDVIEELTHDMLTQRIPDFTR
jgi:hypothetical protein